MSEGPRRGRKNPYGYWLIFSAFVTVIVGPVWDGPNGSVWIKLFYVGIGFWY
jgi:hypothetical protein